MTVVVVTVRTSSQARRTGARLRAEEKAKWKSVYRAQRVRGGRP